MSMATIKRIVMTAALAIALAAATMMPTELEGAVESDVLTTMATTTKTQKAPTISTTSTTTIMKTLINSVTNTDTFNNDNANDDDDMANGFDRTSTSSTTSSFTSTNSMVNDMLTTTTTTTSASASSTSTSSEATIAAATMSTDKTLLNVADMSNALQHFGWMDYFVFILMLVICAAIGFYFGFIEKKKKKPGHNITNIKDKNRSSEQRRDSEALDYLVGGRKMKVLPVSLSLVASFVSGISLLGTSTEIYVYGTQYAFILITLALSGVISWYVFLPVFCNLQLTSTYEYFEMRFGKTLRYFCSILFVVGVILYLPVAIYVPALTFNQVSGINVHIITPVVCVICTFYTCVGGLKAVIWTDAIQSFVMYGTVITICIKGTIDLGGLQVVLERNWLGGRLRMPDLTLDPTVRLSLSAVIIGGTLHKIQSSDVNQISIQRFLSLPNMKCVKQTMFVFTTLLILLLLCCCYIGLLTYATYHDCDPLSTKLAQAHDQLPTILIMRTLGVAPGLAGLFIAGVFSAALSSLSTGLNSLACVMSEDLIKPFLKEPLTERQTTILLRSIVAVFGLTCMVMVFLVERMGTVLQLSVTMGAITMGPALGFYICGVCLPWVNQKSAVIGGVVSFLTLGWICVTAQYQQMHNILRHPKLPVSVDGCSYAYDNNTAWDIVHNYEPSPRDIYHLSFMWYTGFGGILCSIVALLATLIFGSTNIQDIDPTLITPLLRRYLSNVQKINTNKLDVLNGKQSEEQQLLNAIKFKQLNLNNVE